MANDFVNPMNFLDPQYLMGVIEERQDFGAERSKYIGQRFFPRQNFPEQTVVWESVRRENRLAGVYSSRGKAMPGDEIGFATHFANMVWIKAAKTLDPDIVSKIRAPGMVNIYTTDAPFPVQGMAQRVTQKMQEYLTFVDDQIAAQEEYFATQAMLGTLVWPPRDDNGLPISPTMPEWNADEKIEISWPFTAKFVQDILTLAGVPAKTGGSDRAGTQVVWTDTTNANPVHDFEVIADMMMELKGVDVDGAVALMSRKAISYIAEMDKVQRWLRGTNYDRGDLYADTSAVKDRVKSIFGLTLETYDAKWTYLNGVDSDGLEVIASQRFIPTNKMVLVPTGEQIGVMAQAPHETQQGDYVYGKTVHVHRDDKEPHTRELSMSNVVFPLLQQPETIGVFTLF